MAESKQRNPYGGMKAALVRLVLWPPVCDFLTWCARLASRFIPGAASRIARRMAQRLAYWNLEPAAVTSDDDGNIEKSRTGATLLLFHTLPWTGGNWEFTCRLIADLATIADASNDFALKVILHPEQQEVGALRQRAPNVHLLFGKLVRTRAAGMRDWVCTFDAQCRSEALDADVWVSLSDRFAFPFATQRPLVVVAHDVIQRFVPQSFGVAFHVWRARGMTPTLRAARRVIVGSYATAADVKAEYGLPDDKVAVVPVACEPGRRFEAVIATPPPGINLVSNRPFILSVANASPHKGHRLLFAAYARLRQNLGVAPALVCCGGDTCGFSAHRGAGDHPYWRGIRKLLGSLDLREERDLVFLDYVDEAQLLWLYERALVVVNAANYDNGTYCLIEAAHFGRPIVSTRYPAVEELLHRFGVPCHWAPLDDCDALTDAIAGAMAASDTQNPSGTKVSKSGTEEFSTLLYAQRLLKICINLAVPS